MKKRVIITVMGCTPVVSMASDKVETEAREVQRPEKPNVIFFMAEDLSRECFELFCGHGAETPVLQKMAAHGVMFDNAYSNAPVSSAARSSIITGCYAPSYGLSSHRKLEQVTLPEDVWLFPHYLRNEGYYTANAFKTDYNCRMDRQAWDIVKGQMGDWRKRPSADQPFFYCFSINACHESCLHFPETDVDTVPTEYNPEDVVLYPYHPDTKLFRYTYARLYDKINYVDGVLGQMIGMLEEDGLLEDTFIIYMGDNGGCVPFSKGHTNEAGLHVPMVMYIPDNWKDLVPYEAGDVAEGFVSFLDLAPTVLNLAGAGIPEYMDGKPFAGKGVSKRDVESRNVVFGYGDRYDELYAVNRTVRKDNIKYSRNFLPYQPKGIFCNYRYLQAAYREWRRLFEDGSLNDVQSAFFRPQGAEELYDLEKDPYETDNLADDPAYASVLEEMRCVLKSKILEEGDLVLVPEAFWLEHVSDIAGFRESVAGRLPGYFAAADLQTRPFGEARNSLSEALRSDDPVIRYWAVTACCGFGREASVLVPDIKKLLEDRSSVVRSRAAMYCVMNGLALPDDAYRRILSISENKAATLMTLNDMAFLYEYVDAFKEPVAEEDLVYKPNAYKERLAFFNGKFAR